MMRKRAVASTILVGITAVSYRAEAFNRQASVPKNTKIQPSKRYDSPRLDIGLAEKVRKWVEIKLNQVSGKDIVMPNQDS